MIAVGAFGTTLTIDGRPAKPVRGAALAMKMCPVCNRPRRQALWATTGLLRKRFYLVCLNGPSEWMEPRCYGHHETTKSYANLLVAAGRIRQHVSCPMCKQSSGLSIVVNSDGTRFEECGACRWDSRRGAG